MGTIDDIGAVVESLDNEDASFDIQYLNYASIVGVMLLDTHKNCLKCGQNVVPTTEVGECQKFSLLQCINVCESLKARFLVKKSHNHHSNCPNGFRLLEVSSKHFTFSRVQNAIFEAALTYKDDVIRTADFA